MPTLADDGCIALAYLHLLQAKQVVDVADERILVIDGAPNLDEFLADIAFRVVHEQVQPRPPQPDVVLGYGLRRALLDALHDRRIGLGATGGNQLEAMGPVRMRGRGLGRRPTAERLASDVRPVNAHCVQAVHQMLHNKGAGRDTACIDGAE